MDNDPTTVGAVILALRLTLNVVTAVTLVCYLSSHRSRLLPTLAAWLGGGGSMAAFFSDVSKFSAPPADTSFGVFCIVLAFAVVCVSSGGNLAKPFNKMGRRLSNGR